MTDATSRCRVCAARNPPDAAWCSQCYTAFLSNAPTDSSEADVSTDGSWATRASVTSVELRDPTEPLSADPEHDDPTEPLLADLDHDPTEPPSADPDHDPTEPLFSKPEHHRTIERGREPAPAVIQVGRVREVEGHVEWRCSACDGWVALEASLCPRCGSPPSGLGDDRARRRVGDTDADRIRVAGALIPGGGHLVAGRIGSGSTRLILSIFWLVGGVWWLVTTSAGGAVPGLILLAGVVVLWVMSYIDATAIAAGRDERFGPRGLLWSVVGVTGSLMLVVALFAARGSVS